MTIIKLFLLAILLIPVLFIMGTVLSSADMLSPPPAGVYQDRLHNIARAGECLRAQTKELAMKEINLLVKIIQDSQGASEIFEKAEILQRIKAQVETSI